MKCRRCDKPLERLMEDPLCFGCWYVEATEGAHDRFAPLAKALARELEVEPEVWQTGGMTFCLSLVQGGTHRYVMFSEFVEFEHACIGLYRDENDDGLMLHNPRLPYHPENAESIAAWAAPIILRFFAGGGVR